MYKTIEHGIRKTKSGKHEVYVNLPPRENHKEKGYIFHIGTIESLEEAKEIRNKAYEIRKENELYMEDCIEELNKLKEIVKRKYKPISKRNAISTLNMMLYELECNSAFIDFSSFDDEEVERQENWKERKEALELAIKCLRR